MRNQIEYKVYANYALFSDPITRVGGEKCTIQTPTYQALKGITESIYWKPTIIWYIDEVRIMKPIRTESKNMRPINFSSPGNTLSIYTYLRDVEYHVRAHFEWNMNRPEMERDRNENKHFDIAKRMVERGGRRDIFLGTRECQGYVEPCGFSDGESIMTITEKFLWAGNFTDSTTRTKQEKTNSALGSGTQKWKMASSSFHALNCLQRKVNNIPFGLFVKM